MNVEQILSTLDSHHLPAVGPANEGQLVIDVSTDRPKGVCSVVDLPTSEREHRVPSPLLDPIHSDRVGYRRRDIQQSHLSRNAVSRGERTVGTVDVHGNSDDVLPELGGVTAAVVLSEEFAVISGKQCHRLLEEFTVAQRLHERLEVIVDVGTLRVVQSHECRPLLVHHLLGMMSRSAGEPPTLPP